MAACVCPSSFLFFRIWTSNICCAALLHAHTPPLSHICIVRLYPLPAGEHVLMGSPFQEGKSKPESGLRVYARRPYNSLVCGSWSFCVDSADPVSGGFPAAGCPFCCRERVNLLLLLMISLVV